MVRICDLKRGDIVEIDGSPHSVEDVQVSTPSARGAVSLYRFRFRNLVSKHKVDKTFKGDDVLRDVDFERRDIQFSYERDGIYTFTDLLDYSEFTLSADDVGDAIHYLTDATEGLRALVADGRILGLELPSSVDLEIVETAPIIKGASATSRNKPATLSTGLVVQVPEYMVTGERVRVDTRTGKFLQRA
jgi:elongation factor P